MIAFDVAVNGKKVCTAGTERVLSAGVTWTCRSPNTIMFNVGGISDEGGADHHVEWHVPSISVGDVVTIRIIDSPMPDRPIHRPIDRD